MKKILVACACFTLAAHANPFDTPLGKDSLDPAAFAEWTGGAEQPLTDNPRDVLWTQTTQPDWKGVKFGDTKMPGPRHLRLGWQTPVAVGSVLARAIGQLSVLKPDANYPGRLDNDTDWLPAARLAGAEPVADAYVVWTLPPGTTTRALRFTHVTAPLDKSYAGWVGGVFVLPARLANLAPAAQVFTSHNQKYAGKLTDGSNNNIWGTWDNAPDADTPVVSPEHPVAITLAWPKPVTLCGLNALWAGFTAADVQTYTGPADRHPREATETDWQTIRSCDKIENQYPRPLGVNWLDFGTNLTTRAIRLRITRPADARTAHPHVKDKIQNGRRVWLGELLALAPLGDAPLASVSGAAPVAAEPPPPIPIRFTLPKDGFVTLVIDDATGHRVRNLISETKFTAGKHTVWWDGTDDLLRDNEAARHGVYHIPAQFVAPGNYRVRGLWRKPVELRYEFSVYNAGDPAWNTADTSGNWLANHSAPMAVLFVPDALGKGPTVLLGSYVSEGTAGLAWVDLAGRKWKGQGWVGGNWTGAPFLARDAGPNAVPGIYAYVGAAWDASTDKKERGKNGEIRITGLTAGEDKPVARYYFTPVVTEHNDAAWEAHMGGLAVHNGVIVVSLTALNKLLFFDAKTGQTLRETPVESPRGVAFDAQGRLLVIAGTKILRDDAPLVTGLDDPQGIALDNAGNIYVSDHGASHQVKIFAPDGKPLRSIGKPGAPKTGPYDPLHMNHPRGITVDPQGRVWVAEEDAQPKRVSVWNPDGTLAKTFYGPAEYGGGGALDPQDKTKFYYNGMEFRLDWEKGTDELAAVYYRRGPGDLQLAFRSGPPQAVAYVQGRRYFHNSHNSNPTGGHGTAFIFAERNGVAVPVAAAGRAGDWNVLKSGAINWPDGTNQNELHTDKAAFFLWNDLNGDGQVQPNEVTMQRAVCGSVTVQPDLSFAISRLGGKAVRLAPQRFTAAGVPVYDLAKAEILATDTQAPTSSGGDEVLCAASGWTVLTTPPKPFAPQSVGGVFKGEPRWSYPSPWPGLHASHESPAPDHPGEVIGTTRLLGDFITPRGSDAGPVWCINGNQGNIYLFTADGLFVAELFHDVRRGESWAMPVAQRGMLLNGLTLHDENFWPSITQTADGQIYLLDGGRTSLVRVDGLETIRRLPETKLAVTGDDLTNARAWFVVAETRRQQAQGRDTLTVALRRAAPVVDGQLTDWPGADWVVIDQSGVAAYFNSSSKPFDVRAALAVAGDRLYAAFRTGDPKLLRNTGEVPTALFKTGGALDLMITAPENGDERLLVTQVNGKTVATLYRAKVPGTKTPVPFSSPWRTITLDRVDDVSAQVQLAADTDGNFEFSIPLATLGLKPAPGLRLKGDVGILRGNGFQTVQRVYWSNKATAITADVPSEAELTPRLWGRWEFVQP